MYARDLARTFGKLAKKRHTIALKGLTLILSDKSNFSDLRKYQCFL